MFFELFISLLWQIFNPHFLRTGLFHSLVVAQPLAAARSAGIKRYGGRSLSVVEKFPFDSV